MGKAVKARRALEILLLLAGLAGKTTPSNFRRRRAITRMRSKRRTSSVRATSVC